MSYRQARFQMKGTRFFIEVLKILHLMMSSLTPYSPIARVMGETASKPLHLRAAYRILLYIPGMYVFACIKLPMLSEHLMS